MKLFSKISMALAVAASLAGAAQVERAENPPRVIATLDRAEARYNVGENAVFTIAVKDKDGKPVQGTMTVHVDLTCDGGKLIDRKKVEIGTESVTIEHKFRAPGFVRLTAIGRSWQGKLTYVKTFAVAACEPDKIKPVVTMPEDFDEFWERGRRRLADIPLDLKQEKINHLCTEEHDVFKVSFANINDTRIFGYLLIPKNGKDKYPGFVSIAPAGVGKPREDFVDGRMNNISKDQAICLYMGVYDHDLGLPKEYYKNYRSKHGDIRSGTGDAEAYFFYRAILGIDRAVTWLASRDDVDTSRIVYSGNSQGGGMGLVMTGLNKNITAANVNIPALCDHLGFLADRQPGWPGVLGERNRRSMNEEQVAAVTKMLPYFDAVNFARRITVPVLLEMGFQDTTCPPSGVYAAYNSISAPKQIVCDPSAGHGVTATMSAALVPWVREKLGLGNLPDPPRPPVRR